MRKIIFALLLAAVQSHAAGTLATPYAIVDPTGTISVSAPQFNAQQIEVNTANPAAPFICVTFAYGTATVASAIDQSFTVLNSAPTVQACLQMATGAWTATQHDSFGTHVLPGGTLNSTLLSQVGAALGSSIPAQTDAANYLATQTVFPGATIADTWAAQ